MTTLIATLDITKAKDEFGNPVEPNVVFENAVFRFVSSCSMFHLSMSRLLNDPFPLFLLLPFKRCSNRSPSTFDCDLRPRSEQALKIIRQTANSH